MLCFVPLFMFLSISTVEAFYSTSVYKFLLQLGKKRSAEELTKSAEKKSKTDASLKPGEYLLNLLSSGPFRYAR